MGKRRKTEIAGNEADFLLLLLSVVVLLLKLFSAKVRLRDD